MLRRRRSGGDDARGRLLEDARQGDALALAALRADLRPEELAALAALLGPGVEAPVPVLAAARAADGEVLARAVVVLLDGGARSPALVAEVLGRGVDDVLAHGASALPEGPGCRGWVLVARPERLTPAERAAAQAHLDGCRRCRTALGGPAPRPARLPAPRPPA